MWFTINTSFTAMPQVTINANNISHIHEGGDVANNRNMSIYFNNGSDYEVLTFETQVDGDGTKLVQILSDHLYQLPNLRTNVVDTKGIVITSVQKDTPTP